MQGQHSPIILSENLDDFEISSPDLTERPDEALTDFEDNNDMEAVFYTLEEEIEENWEELSNRDSRDDFEKKLKALLKNAEEYLKVLQQEIDTWQKIRPGKKIKQKLDKQETAKLLQEAALGLFHWIAVASFIRPETTHAEVNTLFDSYNLDEVTDKLTNLDGCIKKNLSSIKDEGCRCGKLVIDFYKLRSQITANLADCRTLRLSEHFVNSLPKNFAHIFYSPPCTKSNFFEHIP